MAAKRSDVSTFPSRYSPKKWVTPAQYIVELVCEQAAKHDKRDLPLQFWRNEAWANFFKSQTRKVNQLIKKYDAKVIIATIKKKRIRTLLPKWVEGVIQKEQAIYDAQKKKAELENQDKPEEKNEGIINKPTQRNKRFGSSSLDKILAIDEE